MASALAVPWKALQRMGGCSLRTGVQSPGARERGAQAGWGLLRRKTTIGVDQDPASASSGLPFTTRLRCCHSRIVNGSLVRQMEVQMRLAVFAIHLLRTYFVPGFQSEAPAIPFPAPICSSYSVHQPLLSLKTRPALTCTELTLAQPILPDHPSGPGSESASWAPSAPFLCVPTSALMLG